MKKTLIFGFGGLVLGLVIGFTTANSLNQRSLASTVGGKDDFAPAQTADGKVSPDEQRKVMLEAQAVIEKAKQETDNFEAQMNAGQLFEKIGRFDGAIEYFKRANQLKPDDYDTIVKLGNASFDANHFEEAKRWYSAALERKADDINVRTDLGLTYLIGVPSDLDRAIKEFQRSLATDPNHPVTLQNLTVAYIKKGDPTNAKAALDRFEALNPANPAVVKLRDDIRKLSP